jgi:hypothetical protein
VEASYLTWPVCRVHGQSWCHVTHLYPLGQAGVRIIGQTLQNPGKDLGQSWQPAHCSKFKALNWLSFASLQMSDLPQLRGRAAELQTSRSGRKRTVSRKHPGQKTEYSDRDGSIWATFRDGFPVASRRRAVPFILVAVVRQK